VTEHGAGGFDEEPFDEIELGPVLGGEHELKASLGSRRKPRLGLLRNVRGVIVEDDLGRGRGGVGGLQHSEEFDEFATAVAVLDEGVHLAGQQVDAGHQGDRSMALVLVIAADRWMGAGLWAKVGSDGADRLDAGFLIILRLVRRSSATGGTSRFSWPRPRCRGRCSV
jgi:hypothetical protein